MKQLIGSISLAAMLIGGCSSSPSPPPLPGPAQTHDVKLTPGGAEVASMPGPFCQPQDDAAGTGSRCDDGRKRMEALAKSRNIPQITPPVTAALEPLGAKAPKPPLIGRAKVEAIARAYDSTMKWDPPVFSEGMRFTVNGERAVRPVWVAAGGQPNGNRLTLYIDPLTGAIWSQERVFKGG